MKYSLVIITRSYVSCESVFDGFASAILLLAWLSVDNSSFSATMAPPKLQHHFTTNLHYQQRTLYQHSLNSLLIPTLSARSQCLKSHRRCMRSSLQPKLRAQRTKQSSKASPALYQSSMMIQKYSSTTFAPTRSAPGIDPASSRKT